MMSNVLTKKSTSFFIVFFIIGTIFTIALFAFTDNVKAQTLGHTQISGTLPEKETEGSAFIQWGGGTLYQLTARLAVNGCDLNLLWVWDSNTKRYTAGYTFDGPSFLNNNFNNLYKDNIPPSVIWVKCIDMINHVYGYGLLTDDGREYANNLIKGGSIDFSYIDGLLIGCGNNWKEEVKSYTLNILPIIQGTCIAYFEEVNRDTVYFSRAFTPFQYHQYKHIRYIFIYNVRQSSVLVNNSNKYGYNDRLRTELHELCHVHQDWYVAKNVFNYDFFRKISEDEQLILRTLEQSAYMKEFIDMSGF